MHSLVHTYVDEKDENRHILNDISGSCYNGGPYNPDVWESFQMPTNRDNTAIAIDENYEYGVWVSFAEIYTEKIYDLLIKPDRLSKRKALALKYEYSSGHKYISGLNEVRVKTIQVECKFLFGKHCINLNDNRKRMRFFLRVKRIERNILPLPIIPVVEVIVFLPSKLYVFLLMKTITLSR